MYVVTVPSEYSCSLLWSSVCSAGQETLVATCILEVHHQYTSASLAMQVLHGYRTMYNMRA